MGSQIDQFLLRVVRQINHPEERILDINLRVGAEGVREGKHAMFLSFADYLHLLQEYEKKDLRLSPKEVIVAPILDSRVILMEQSISICDLCVCLEYSRLLCFACVRRDMHCSCEGICCIESEGSLLYWRATLER